MKEHGFIQKEYDKLISESGLEEATKNLTETNKNYREYMDIDWMANENLGKYDINKALDLQRKYYEASNEVFNIEQEARKLARENVIEFAEQAQQKYNEIISKENPELSAVKQNVENILRTVPTFENEASNLADMMPYL